MSCISLRLRLPPARKAWKSFISSLAKIHKIRSSKAMKKPRKHVKSITTQKVNRAPPKFLVTKRFRRKKLTTFKSVIYGFNKKPAPVYIDKLFKEPSCDLVGHLKPQTGHKPRIQKTEKVPHQLGKEQEVAGTSRGGTPDDMWESITLGSPQMQGIDERAEEFITRFRRQMAAQEKLARNL